MLFPRTYISIVGLWLLTSHRGLIFNIQFLLHHLAVKWLSYFKDGNPTFPQCSCSKPRTFCRNHAGTVLSAAAAFLKKWWKPTSRKESTKMFHRDLLSFKHDSMQRIFLTQALLVIFTPPTSPVICGWNIFSLPALNFLSAFYFHGFSNTIFSILLRMVACRCNSLSCWIYWDRYAVICSKSNLRFDCTGSLNAVDIIISISPAANNPKVKSLYPTNIFVVPHWNSHCSAACGYICLLTTLSIDLSFIPDVKCVLLILPFLDFLDPTASTGTTIRWFSLARTRWWTRWVW